MSIDQQDMNIDKLDLNNGKNNGKKSKKYQRFWKVGKILGVDYVGEAIEIE